MAKLKEVETHELTEAQVHEIHKHGSPHQHLDPNPHEEISYSGLQAKQYLDAAKGKRDAIRSEVGEKLKAVMPRQVIPRYLRRAVWSKDPAKIQKAITKAKAEGWTNEEMVRQVRLISEYNVQESN